MFYTVIFIVALLSPWGATAWAEDPTGGEPSPELASEIASEIPTVGPQDVNYDQLLQQRQACEQNATSDSDRVTCFYNYVGGINQGAAGAALAAANPTATPSGTNYLSNQGNQQIQSHIQTAILTAGSADAANIQGEAAALDQATQASMKSGFQQFKQAVGIGDGSQQP